MLRSTIRVMGLVAVLTAAAFVAPAPASAQAAGPGTTVWVGLENLPGYGQLEFRFTDGGGVVMIDAREVCHGTFTRSGNFITLSFPGRATYSGTINDGRMSGTARSNNGTWSWHVAFVGHE